jgi:hypothetical protein
MGRLMRTLSSIRKPHSVVVVVVVAQIDGSAIGRYIAAGRETLFLYNTTARRQFSSCMNQTCVRLTELV